jgi:serine protease Do
LAIIKIPLKRPLPLIRIGTSRDLMKGEEVIAVGNAYGYEHTVTRGIISALHRTVQVNDTQTYADLIQTDASINPGNSGGPLLNIDGDMIGVNVATRVGAQGIGFAIPVDKAMEVAAQLLSIEQRSNLWHGIVTGQANSSRGGSVFARSVQRGSPAEVAGIQAGDRILRVNSLEVQRELDLERALLGLRAGQEASILLQRDNQPIQLRLKLAALQKRRSAPTTGKSVLDLAWDKLGLRLAEEPVDEVRQSSSPFKGGLRVLSVRPASPAARQGVRPGDLLVGLHKWETSSIADLAYILKEPNVAVKDSVKFYVLRGDETLYGHLPVTWRR